MLWKATYYDNSSVFFHSHENWFSPCWRQHHSHRGRVIHRMITHSESKKRWESFSKLHTPVTGKFPLYYARVWSVLVMAEIKFVSVRPASGCLVSLPWCEPTTSAGSLSLCDRWIRCALCGAFCRVRCAKLCGMFSVNQVRPCSGKEDSLTRNVRML